MSENTVPSFLPQLQVELLDLERAKEIFALETQCYPSPWSYELIRNEFFNDISVCLGLKLQDAVVAYSFSHLLPPELHLLNLAVAPEYRKLGLGHFLLCHLILFAAQREVETVLLEVREGNVAAKSLYASLGFRFCGIRPSYYQDNGEDALLLELSLSSALVETLENNILSLRIKASD